MENKGRGCLDATGHFFVVPLPRARYNLAVSEESDISEHFQNAHKIALEALAKMAGEKIPPSPKNYAVWFAYFSHLHPELAHAIDIIAKGPTKADPEQLERLYNSYLHEAVAEEQAVTKVGDQLQGTLARVQEMIKEMGVQTSQFTSNLGSATDRLDSASLNPDDIKQIVGQLVDDAKAMLEQNEGLKTRLAESSSELTELKQDLASVREESMTDALTGIANRKAFDMRLLQAAAEATEDGEPLCLLIVDIDFFKKFNDTYGHQAGDQIIRLVAQTFKKGLKGQDTAARYGGEEFGIVLPKTEIANAVRVAEVLRRTVAMKEVVNRSNQEKLGQITISVGTTQYRIGESIESFIERADSALYRAKENGRNRVEVEA